MRSLRVSLWALGLSSLLLSCQPKAAAPDTALQLPLLADSKELNWPADAFQVEILTPRPSSQPLNASRLALAWTPEGLRVWADVQDDSPAEAGDAASLWMGDSIELFVASPHGAKDFIQLICAPGRVPEHSQPRWQYINHGKSGTVLKDPEIQVLPRSGGYLLSVLFPWSNLSVPPKEGDKVGVQLYLNNVSSGSGKTRMVWFPSEDNARTSAYYELQLARKAGAPQKVVASLDMEKLSLLVLKVSATADLAGKPLQLRAAGTSDWKEIGVLGAAEAGFCRASLALPASLTPSAGEKVEVKIGGVVPPALEVPDIQKARVKVLLGSAVVSKPSVFGTKDFPPIEFLNKELVEGLFGPCEYKIRYFNSAYEEVKEAATPGRYGALVDIRTAEGLTDQRRITLYRTAQPFSTRTDRFESGLRFPVAFGLPADITQREKGAADDFLNYRLHSLARLDTDWAVFLAGLQDLGLHPKEFHGFDTRIIDQDWWYGLEKKIGTAKPYEYLLYLPKGYDPKSEKVWPLVLFLHGSGERGTDLNLVKKNGLSKRLEEGADYPFITVVPQCPTGVWWSAGALNDLVDQVSTLHRVDSHRLYVTGLSMGGYGSWNLAGHYPEKYAAAVPVCGGALPDLAPRLKNMPVWAFHGDKDPSVPLQASQGMVDAIAKAGGKARLTVYPGVGHDSWTQAYADPELYAWLLQQKR